VKRRQVVRQRRRRPAKPQLKSPNLNRPALDLSRETYLTVDQTIAYLKFPTANAVHLWASRKRVPKCRRGRIVLFLRRDLDNAVQQSREVHGGGR
jgi:hypothetical protein